MNKIFDGKRYWLLDGAMGTMLQKSGLKLGERPDLLSITHPDVVERINRAYVEAGSDLICANTFGSNAKKLAGCGYTVEEVVAAGQLFRKTCCGRNRGACDAGRWPHRRTSGARRRAEI